MLIAEYPRKIILVLTLTISAACASAADHDEPLNVKLTNAAWAALGHNEFEKAIDEARKCIEVFKIEANEQQARLVKTGTPNPPKGGSFSESQSAEIHSRGLLNDVAASYFITGQALEKLGRKGEARKAYLESARYTYARVWDPRGWFWSPAEASEKRLQKLGN